MMSRLQEDSDMQVPSGDHIMAYEQSNVAERVARRTAHDSKLAAKRMAMLDEGHFFLYASLVACCLGRRLRNMELIAEILEKGKTAKQSSVIERYNGTIYTDDDESDSADDDTDIILEETVDASSERENDASDLEPNVGAKNDNVNVSQKENDNVHTDGRHGLIAKTDEENEEEFFECETDKSNPDVIKSDEGKGLAYVNLTSDSCFADSELTFSSVDAGANPFATKGKIRRKKTRKQVTSIADSYRENLAEHKVVDDEQLEYKDMESMKSGKMVAKNDSEWAEEFLHSLIQCLDLSEAHSMVVHMSFRTRVGPETFADELRTSPEIALAIMQDLIMFSVHQGTYDSRSRALVREIVTLLRVAWVQAELFENQLAHYLRDRHKQFDEELEEERRQKEQRNRIKRYAIGTSAAVAGAVIIGVTAGVAAPIFAAGTGAVLGASAGAFFATKAGIALTTTLFTGVGLGLGAHAAHRRLGDLKHFQVAPLTEHKLAESDHYLHVVIAISGMIYKTSDLTEPWKHIEETGERYAVVWEPKELRAMGTMLRDILVKEIPSNLVQQILALTVLTTVMSAIQLPIWLTKLTYLLNHPWARCINRADKAAIVLADLLARRVHGNRPVVLVGYSFGARVIFMALEHLAKRKVPVRGVVDTVYLLGAPVPSDDQQWATVASVVGGEIFNCYSRTDWVLGLMYRTANLKLNVAGLGPIEGIPNVHNIDLTTNAELGVDLVYGHDDYCTNLHALLYKIGLTKTPPPDPDEEELAAEMFKADLDDEKQRTDSTPIDSVNIDGREEPATVTATATTTAARDNAPSSPSLLRRLQARFTKRQTEVTGVPLGQSKNDAVRREEERQELEQDAQWDSMRAELEATAANDDEVQQQTKWLARVFHRARRMQDTESWPAGDDFFDNENM